VRRVDIIPDLCPRRRHPKLDRAASFFASRGRASTARGQVSILVDIQFVGHGGKAMSVGLSSRSMRRPCEGAALQRRR